MFATTSWDQEIEPLFSTRSWDLPASFNMGGLSPRLQSTHVTPDNYRKVQGSILSRALIQRSSGVSLPRAPSNRNVRNFPSVLMSRVTSSLPQSQRAMLAAPLAVQSPPPAAVSPATTAPWPRPSAPRGKDSGLPSPLASCRPPAESCLGDDPSRSGPA